MATFIDIEDEGSSKPRKKVCLSLNRHLQRPETQGDASSAGHPTTSFPPNVSSEASSDSSKKQAPDSQFDGELADGWWDDLEVNNSLLELFDENNRKQQVAAALNLDDEADRLGSLRMEDQDLLLDNTPPTSAALNAIPCTQQQVNATEAMDLEFTSPDPNPPYNTMATTSISTTTDGPDPMDDFDMSLEPATADAAIQPVSAPPPGPPRRQVGENVFTEAVVKTWQDSRIKAWEGRYLNPEGFYYRFVTPGEGQQNGGWSSKEHDLFMKRYDEWIGNNWKMGAAWGLFSCGIPHRVGYQCMNYYRKLLENRKLKDEAYEVVNGKLKLVNKEKASGGATPVTELGPEWKDEYVKEIEANVEEWLKQYHQRTGSAATRPPPKPRSAPKVARTTKQRTSSSSGKISRLIKDQHRFKRTGVDGDDEYMDAQEPEQANISERRDWALEWVERLTSYKAFVEQYREKHIRHQYWIDKQEWRRGLATTEMRMNRQMELLQKQAQPETMGTKRPEPHQASLSRFFSGVKKAKIDTPDELIHQVRIPNDLYSSVKHILPLSRQLCDAPVPSKSMYFEVTDMMACVDLLKEQMQEKVPSLSNIEGLLIDPPWEYNVNDGRHDGSCSWNLYQMKMLLSQVLEQMSAGLIFIWIHKLIQADVVRMMSSLGCRYVENLVWFKKSVNNVPLDIPSPYISSTKEILLMFKKGEGIDLRHQRTADVIIDFEHPLADWTHQEYTEPKPPAVYDMIETLLPQAGYNENLKRGRFVELWAKRANPKRDGWLAFHQIKSFTGRLPSSQPVETMELDLQQSS